MPARVGGVRFTQASLVRSFAVAVAIGSAAPRLAAAQVDSTPLPSNDDGARATNADAAWNARLAAAWKLGFAKEWTGARARFDSLHREQPRAIEPVIGLGYVARGQGRYGTARDRFREALALDSTSTKARELLHDTEWERPSSLRLEAGSTDARGSLTSTWGALAEIPATQRLSFTGRFALLGGGDAFQGIFLNPESGGVRQWVASAGVIAQASDRLTMTVRGDRWTSSNDTTQTFVWLDGALKASDRIIAHLNARPIAAGDGEPQFGGGVEYTVRQTQVLKLDFSQGIRQAEFDARTVVRAFYNVDPSRTISYRAGIVGDIDHRFGAATVVGTLTWFARPTLGIRTELSDREGKFAKRSGTAGLVIRW